jgi:hypothetical protein
VLLLLLLCCAVVVVMNVHTKMIYYDAATEKGEKKVVSNQFVMICEKSVFSFTEIRYNFALKN